MTTIELLTMTQAQIDALAERLTARPEIGLLFRDVPLPPGCSPRLAHLRLEVPPVGTGVQLVCSPFEYVGDDHELDRWSADGVTLFPALPAALTWLEARYPGRPASGNHPPAVAVTRLNEIAVGQTDNGESDRPRMALEPLVASLVEEVVGQDHAVHLVVRTSLAHLAQVASSSPAVLLLLGPTGTGKTSLVEALARHANLPLARVDLGEYVEEHRIASLLGAPPGYVGYGTPSPLVETLRNTPRCLILLDEWEKAHPRVRRALLAFLDSGRLTNGEGRTIEAPEAVAFLTSNQGADDLAVRLDAAEGWNKPSVVTRAATTLLQERGVAPEELSRIDVVAAFRPLPASVQSTLAVLALRRLASCYALELVWVDPQVVGRILAARDMRGGSRGLHRAASLVAGFAFAQAALPPGSPVSLVSELEGVQVVLGDPSTASMPLDPEGISNEEENDA